jgi:hypothetical protein
MFTSDTKNGQKKDLFLPVHMSGKTQVVALNGALANIPSMNSRIDAAGDLEEDCQNSLQTPEYRRLPITKKRVERKDRGVVACPPVSLTHLHGILQSR